ncbi:AsmA protein [Paramagnetospirillum magnetotacticum MS-1]|uniref:AsmA protein n=1 Tax=Paramagnetospirillum magnetotacticum MS-1 TaxID=272627 RepID=A0A0C2YWP5_PARME|nr:AsmA protein [Paramagnetospirillum magnetotacticum MS-1]
MPVSPPTAIAAALIAGGLALVLAAPALMDGDAWRGRIETEASALLRRKVTVAGPISLRILPSPAVTLAAVAVEGTASLDRVRLGLSLGSLLAGRPQLDDVVMEGGRVGPLVDLSLRAVTTGESFAISGSARLWGKSATLEAKGRRPTSTESMAPLKAAVSLPSLESGASFDGSFGKGALSGKLDVSLASLARFTGSAQLPDAPLSAQAELRLSPDEVVISDLGVILGESTITGSVVASLTAPALMDVTLRADSFDLDSRRAAISAKTEQPKSATATTTATPASQPQQTAQPSPAASQPFELPHGLAANLDVGIGRLKWRGETISNIQINALLEGERLTLSQASAKLPGAGFIKLTGSMVTPEGRPRFDGTLKAESRNLPELRKWLSLGSSAAPIRGKLEGKVQLAENRLALNALTLDLDERRVTGMISAGLALPIPLKAELGLPGLALGFDGVLSDGRIDGGASLRAAGFAQAIRALAPGYHPRGNGELAVSAHVEGANGLITLTDLQAKAGEAQITGKASLSLEGQPKLTANLAGNAIGLDPFLPAPNQDKGEESKPRRRTGYAAPPPPPIIPAALSSGSSSWSRTALDLGWLQSLDADLSLEAKTVTVSGWRLDQPRAHLGLAKGIADLDRFSARLLGGEMAAAARLAANGLTLSANLKGADLAQVKPAAGGLKLEKGTLGADLRLAAAGTSPAALVASLSGNGRVDVNDGEVAGFDLAAMDARMRNMENLGSLLGLVQAGLSGGKSRFSSLSGTFNADKGIVVSRDLTLVAEGGGATGIATIDLPQETISSKIAFKLAAPGAPALGLRLDGPLASPNKAVDINDLQRWLVEKGLGKALNPKGAGESSDAPKKFKAGDALRGLFSAFGKKKE